MKNEDMNDRQRLRELIAALEPVRRQILPAVLLPSCEGRTSVQFDCDELRVLFYAMGEAPPQEEENPGLLSREDIIKRSEEDPADDEPCGDIASKFASFSAINRELQRLADKLSTHVHVVGLEKSIEKISNIDAAVVCLDLHAGRLSELERVRKHFAGELDTYAEELGQHHKKLVGHDDAFERLEERNTEVEREIQSLKKQMDDFEKHVDVHPVPTESFGARNPAAEERRRAAKEVYQELTDTTAALNKEDEA